MSKHVNTPLFGFSTLQAATVAEGDNAAVWQMIMPAGKFQARDGRGPFDAGDKISMQQIIDRSVAFYAGVELMLDYDHQSLHSAGEGKGGTAIASGWFKQLEARDDGIWGLVEWTPAAAEKIRGKEYRYISPLFTTVKGSGKVWRIDNAALVNQPAVSMQAVAAATNRFNNEDAPQMNELLAKLAKALGLKDGSSEDVILASAQAFAADRGKFAVAAGVKADAATDEVLTALAAKKADSAVDETQFVPMSMFKELQTKLETSSTAAVTEKAEEAVKVAMAEGKITPANREWALGYAKRDLVDFQAFVARSPKMTAQQIHNPTPKDGKPALSDEDTVAMSALGLTEEQFVAARKLEVE